MTDGRTDTWIRVFGSVQRLHKMTVCVTLIERHEQQRPRPYSLVFMSGPDLLVCKLRPMRLLVLDVPEGTIFVFRDGGVLNATATATVVLPDHLFLARREESCGVGRALARALRRR